MDQNTLNILIVDDNRDIHEIIKDFFDLINENEEDLKMNDMGQELFGQEGEKSGSIFSGKKFNFVSCFQGEDAVHKVEESINDHGKKFAIAFMDIRMPPGIDGIQTTEKIWKIDPQLPVLICSAYSDYTSDDIKGKFKIHHNMDFLPKPFELNIFQEKTMHLMEKGGRC